MAKNEPKGSARATAREDLSGATAAGSGVESGSAARGTQAATDARSMADIGIDEAWATNVKRMVENALSYDGANLTEAAQIQARRNRNSENSDDERQRLANLSLSQAVENSNQLAKIQLSERERTVRHSDLAIDRQWNVDEVAQLVAKTAVFQDAIAGAVAAGVAAGISKK